MNAVGHLAQVTTMRAIVHDRYGSPEVLELKDVDTPRPLDDEVLVRVHAASVNQADWIALTGRPYVARLAFGLFRPKLLIPGIAMAGRVAAVGRNITQFKPGDEVFGEVHSAYAEYVCVAQDRIGTKPSNLTFEQSAAVPLAGITALQGLRDAGRVQRGQHVLINGASGGVGTFAVQIAKALGAHVTAVTSTRNLELVRSMSPDLVIDYTQEDFTRRPERYDVVFDVAADRSFKQMRRVLTPNGRIVLAGAAKKSAAVLLARVLTSLVLTRLGSKWLVMHMAAITTDDLVVLKGLAEAGKLMPVIDREYPLTEAAEAVRYVGTGQARAKVVITMEPF
jgi:NADPH:quinone reductase-like Zn-dependent oxidoreductase